MRAAESSLFDISESPERLLAADAERIFDAVWRTDFSAPGFCLLDLGRDVDSHDLRAGRQSPLAATLDMTLTGVSVKTEDISIDRNRPHLSVRSRMARISKRRRESCRNPTLPSFQVD